MTCLLSIACYPDLDGLTFGKNSAQRRLSVPVLFLTTMCGIDDRVEGLNAGADDYLVKPFAFSELEHGSMPCYADQGKQWNRNSYRFPALKST